VKLRSIVRHNPQPQLPVLSPSRPKSCLRAGALGQATHESCTGNGLQLPMSGAFKIGSTVGY
jgi:hypothetical protein